MPESQAVTNRMVNSYDSESKCFGIIDTTHKHIHDGSSFFINYYATKNAAQSLDIALVTPTTATYEYHIVFDVSSSGSGTAYFYKDSTLSNNGTGLTEYNNDFNSATTTALAAYHTPTVDAVGTTVWSQVVNALGSAKSGGNTGTRFEYILQANKKYLLRFTADGNGTIIHWNVYWYQVEE